MNAELKHKAPYACYGLIAQLVEPPAHNRMVPGSIPGEPTIV